MQSLKFSRCGWIVAAVLISLAGCETNNPWRTVDAPELGDSLDTECKGTYAAFDTAIWGQLNDPNTTDDTRAAFLTQQDAALRKARDSPCWKRVYEQHASDSPADHEAYDVFYAQFDDQGMPTDIAARNLSFNQSAGYFIETKLRKILTEEEQRHGGINLVVFTHGWHGDAAAFNDYSTEFKAILQKVTAEEAANTVRSRQAFYSVDSKGTRTPVTVANRRTVGIEIAWRGDSLTFPTKYINIWDRKHAAETVAKGSIHELLAFLHEFYLMNSCHGEFQAESGAEATCDRVHMLTLGHSFGALINFNTLISRIEAGLNEGCGARAFAYGDLTVLLNPAFEGSRYAPAFANGMHHPDTFGSYPGGSESNAVCSSARSGPATADVQIPVLVTLQSKGDTATGDFFPIFKFFSTPFTNTPFDDEAVNERHAAGWVPQFTTHHLGLQKAGDSDSCYRTPADPPWYCPKGWAVTTIKPIPDPVNQSPELHEYLQWIGDPHEKFPDYMPLWSVMVDKNIMKDHDDIWNPRIVTLIAHLFRDAYEQADAIHYRHARAAEPGIRSIEPDGVARPEKESIAIRRGFE